MHFGYKLKSSRFNRPSTMLFVTAPLFSWLTWNFPNSQNSGKQRQKRKKPGTFDVLFLGTGVSTGLPSLAHAMNPQCRTFTKSGTKVCVDALRPNSKNRRCNVSIIIDATLEDGSNKRLMVDCGKTFRETILRHAVPNDIDEIDGLLVTHPHADAMLGLDDIRDLQKYEYIKENGKTVGYQVECAFPIISNEMTVNYMQKVFPYLVGKSLPWVPGREKEMILERRVPYLDWMSVDNFAILRDETFGIPVRLFPVWHGKPLISLGFAFGESYSFVYISDVSECIPESFEFLKSIPVIRVLVLDCLNVDGHNTHFCLSDAIEFAKSLGNVRKTFLVGMGCSVGDHDVRNEQLKSEDIDVQLAFDGMWIEDFPLIDS